MIVETEAYGGPHDEASHARSGKTARNWPMYERGGTIYVYLTYGMHWMLNISTGKQGSTSAVLIRGLRALDDRVQLDGPARLTKHLHIDKSLTGKVLSKKVGLWAEDRGMRIRGADIRRTPRIGVEYAGDWARKPWRFITIVHAPRR